MADSRYKTISKLYAVSVFLFLLVLVSVTQIPWSQIEMLIGIVNFNDMRRCDTSAHNEHTSVVGRRRRTYVQQLNLLCRYLYYATTTAACSMLIV